MEAGDGSGTPLVERGSELSQLEKVLAATDDAGEGAFALIHGPAGIGKSRLMAAGRELAGEFGFRVLSAQGGELERDFAYGVARQLFEHTVQESEADRDRLLAGAAGLCAPALGIEIDLPKQEPGQASDASFPVLHGLYWLTANLAESRPLMLAIDDLHWADSPSLRFLDHLVRRLEGLPIVVLAASRPGEPAGDRSDLDRIEAEASPMIRPPPLSGEGLRSVIEEMLGEEPDETFVEAIERETGGNPFFVGELLRAIAGEGRRPDRAAAARVHDLGLEGVSSAVRVRLAALPQGCDALARAVAVFGASSSVANAAALAELDAKAADAAVEELAAVQILGHSHGLSFTHPVLRTATYHSISHSDLTHLHERAAEILADQGASAAEIAPHLLAAHPSGSQEVVAQLREAAALAIGQGAADLARRYLDRAMEEPVDGSGLIDLSAELGAAEWLAGDSERAIAHMRAAVEATTDPVLRAQRSITVARALLQANREVEAIELLDSEAEHVAGEDAGLSRDLTAQAISIGLARPTTRARASERIAGVRSEREGDAASAVDRLNQATYESMWGTAQRTAELVESVIADRDFAELEAAESFTVNLALWSAAMTDSLERIGDVAEALADTATRRASVFDVAAWRALLATIAYRRGRLQTAEIEARAGLEASPGGPQAPVSLAILTLTVLERRVGVEAERELEALERELGPMIDLSFTIAVLARGHLRLATGRPAEALEDFAELEQRELAGDPDRPSFPWRSGAALAYLAVEDQERAQALAAEQLERAERWGAASAVGSALRVSGLVAGRDGLDSLAEAVKVLERSPARLEHARALVDHGSALRRTGTRAAAREPLTEGLEQAQELGAAALAERAATELQTAGATPRRRQFSGLDSLTASEARIARLVSTGKTNRDVAQELFVTMKTVENHLSRIYSKLDISSRHDLPEALTGVAEN